MDKLSEEQRMNFPVYMSYETLRSPIKSEVARLLVRPGKIYFKDNYLLIVEQREGIHLIDVSNPGNPQNKLFIEVPGCTDIAIKNNSLYVDSYVDLITIDLSNITQPKESKRLNDAFAYTIPTPALENQKLPYAHVDQKKGVVIAWEVKREKRELERRFYPPYPFRQTDYLYAEYSLSSRSWAYGGLATANSGSGAVSFGTGGSMARFGLYNKYLYIADTNSLYLFDVADATSPFSAGKQWLNGFIETMFIYDNHIFFGTPTGMLVYDLRVPSVPKYKNQFAHLTACDPVVVQDGYAYITLRGGTACNNSTINCLDIVECLDNYTRYELIESYSLTEPYGLGIDGSNLFVCDGKAGLKVYDVTDKKNIDKNMIAAFPAIQTYDVIPAGGYLFMIGSDGFYLYDYSDIRNIRQIGHIPVAKK
jgi:hypothetical protein